jgi:lipopolysaccharide/colanic/teichoic acid biosynthesis glycosyltransferase
MKTHYVFIGQNPQFINRMKHEKIDLVEFSSTLSAVNYVQNNKHIEVVIYEAPDCTETALKFIKYFREQVGKDFLFYVLVKEERQIANLGIKGVDDIFPIDVDVNNINRQVHFLLENPDGDSLGFIKHDNTSIPLWKRIFDIVFSSLAILFLSPLLLIIVIAIRVESKGKVFYSSKRIGAGYKIFNFYKLRSMYIDADSKVSSLISQNQYADDKVSQEANSDLNISGKVDSLLITDEKTISEQEYLQKKRAAQSNTFFKMANDPRITKVGRLIRNTSIDELPQLFNILKGDMSVVGNRPLPLYEAEMLTTDKWSKRFLAPAGLTGLWQVTKRGNSNAMSADERKQLDIEYVDKFSFFGDLSIILRTIPALLQHENV